MESIEVKTRNINYEEIKIDQLYCSIHDNVVGINGSLTLLSKPNKNMETVRVNINVCNDQGAILDVERSSIFNLLSDYFSFNIRCWLSGRFDKKDIAYVELYLTWNEKEKDLF